jgi:putative membrane protein
MLRWTLLSSAIAFAPAWAQGNPTATGGSLTDPQIAEIVITANQAGVDAAKLAKSHSTNKDVLSLANTMARDHEASNKQTKELAKKLHVKPEQSATSEQMSTDAKENLASLKKLKGPAFDKAYLDHEVTFHQQVLSSIQNDLIPNAKNAQLKSLLEKTAPVIQAHLDHAKSVQSKVSGVGGGG